MFTPLVLRVLRASDSDALGVGSSFAIHEPSVVIGRSPDADLVLADPSVSRRHVRLDVGPPIVVQSLTDTNGTFVAGQPLAPGQPIELPTEGSELQLGGVLLSIALLPETEPVLVSLNAEARPDARFHVILNGGHCVVKYRGVDLGLTAAAARFFGSLAERPGEVVHRWDLEQDLGTPHLPPLATQVRRGLAEATDQGILDLRWFRNDDEPLEVVLRRLIQNRRGFGYVLNLAPKDVVVTRI